MTVPADRGGTQHMHARYTGIGNTGLITAAQCLKVLNLSGTALMAKGCVADETGAKKAPWPTDRYPNVLLNVHEVPKPYARYLMAQGLG